MRPVRKETTKQSIAIVPYGGVDINQFCDSLEAAALLFGLEPVISGSSFFVATRVTPEESQRKQKNAETAVLDAQAGLRLLDEKWSYAIMVTNYDLFVKGMPFVFGSSNVAERTGIVSTARLTQWEEGITPSKIKERVLKEAAHEIGHLGRLAHCSTETCIMYYATSLAGVDGKLPLLCEGCLRNLKTSGR